MLWIENSTSICHSDHTFGVDFYHLSRKFDLCDICHQEFTLVSLIFSYYEEQANVGEAVTHLHHMRRLRLFGCFAGKNLNLN